MKDSVLEQLKESNPWLEDANNPVLRVSHYIPRVQSDRLLLTEWDNLWTILIGPRRAGKTTLGFALCEALIAEQRYKQLLYLNCDYLTIRQGLIGPEFITQVAQIFKLEEYILYIDEVQRLENPGLLLKTIIDLQWPIKLIATGSSQLEMKSKIQEHLTGRQIESLILPLSYTELENGHTDKQVIFGCYPQIVESSEQGILLQQLYNDYLRKDIIEFLKIGKPDVVEKLLALLAHNSGQLVNYSQLATDCQVNIATIKHYLEVLEKTFVILKITPFVGNKRAEITTNPIYYFLDNGFRNQALNNFSSIESRTDAGFLIESAVLQELYKFKTQTFKNFIIHYWRTKGGAEVDFVIYQNAESFIPVEVKYREMNQAKINRGFRSFIETYQPKIGFIITKDYNDHIKLKNSTIHFISFKNITQLFSHLS